MLSDENTFEMLEDLPCNLNYLIKKLINPNYLFARKFTKESDISEYIPELYSLYNTKPMIVWNRCNAIFNNIDDQIILKENVLFSYLSNNAINDYPIYDKIYHLYDFFLNNLKLPPPKYKHFLK